MASGGVATRCISTRAWGGPCGRRWGLVGDSNPGFPDRPPGPNWKKKGKSSSELIYFPVRSQTGATSRGLAAACPSQSGEEARSARPKIVSSKHHESSPLLFQVHSILFLTFILTPRPHDEDCAENFSQYSCSRYWGRQPGQAQTGAGVRKPMRGH